MHTARYMIVGMRDQYQSYHYFNRNFTTQLGLATFPPGEPRGSPCQGVQLSSMTSAHARYKKVWLVDCLALQLPVGKVTFSY